MDKLESGARAMWLMSDREALIFLAIIALMVPLAVMVAGF